MAKEKILIVDDEEYIRKIVKKSLLSENFLIEEASSGETMLKKIEDCSFDLIILDIMLEDQDGFELIKVVRSLGIQIPILLLSGRNEDYDKILGLGIGADDYITKPFNPAVLSARVKAHIRRYKELVKLQSNSSNLLKQGDFIFDLKTLKFYKNDKEIDLSYKENMLIKFFMENPRQVFTKQQLYENVWSDTIIDDNCIMVYIHHLRKKIEVKPDKPKHLQTIWGIGYKFVP